MGARMGDSLSLESRYCWVSGDDGVTRRKKEKEEEKAKVKALGTARSAAAVSPTSSLIHLFLSGRLFFLAILSFLSFLPPKQNKTSIIKQGNPQTTK